MAAPKPSTWIPRDTGALGRGSCGNISKDIAQGLQQPWKRLPRGTCQAPPESCSGVPEGLLCDYSEQNPRAWLSRHHTGRCPEHLAPWPAVISTAAGGGGHCPTRQRRSLGLERAAGQQRRGAPRWPSRDEGPGGWLHNPASQLCLAGSRSAHHTRSMPSVSFLHGSGSQGRLQGALGAPSRPSHPQAASIPPLQPPPPPAVTQRSCYSPFPLVGGCLFFFFSFLFQSMTSLLCFGRVTASARE